MIKKHFNNVCRSFESSHKYQICNKLFADGDKKVRDRVTGKCKGSAHQNCNINLKLTTKDSVIFHDLKDYDR